jgi:TRAP transporter TAXI family solute receptor
MKSWFFLSVVVISIIIVASTGLPLFAGAQPSPQRLPKLISITTYSAGTGVYMKGVAIREVLERLTPMKVRIEPYASPVGQILAIKKGEGVANLSVVSSICLAHEGKLDFATADWGPQPLRIVWLGDPMIVGWMVRGTSNIHAMADLKGKKISVQEGSPTQIIQFKALLAWNNWTRNDVVVKKFGSTALGYKSVLEGSADAYHAACTAPQVLELESSPYGVRFLEMPSSNTEAWSRIRQWVPYKPIVATRGPKWVQENKPQLYGAPYGIWAYSFADENVIYEIVKNLHKGYNMLKGMHPDLPDWTIENAVAVAQNWQPFHPGAIRYFKEAGVWTQELEKYQKERLQAELDMSNAFKKDTAAWYQKYAVEILK